MTVANFTVDNVPIANFTHNPTSSKDLEYNQLVFSNTGLTNETHNLKASVSGLKREIWIGFDYALYTSAFFFYNVSWNILC